MKLAVHTFTRKTLIAEYGSDHIHVGSTSPLLPHLIVRPRYSNRQLNDHIIITGKESILSQIHPDAGHNLYVAHMAQLVDWISKHAIMQMGAWTAMIKYYSLIGLDYDDLPPERTYKQWQRSVERKKSKNHLYNQPVDVLNNIAPLIGGVECAIDDAASIIQRHPDHFFRADDQPDIFMVRKVLMYAMSDIHHIHQVDIASYFDISQPTVSEHINDFRALYQRLLS